MKTATSIALLLVSTSLIQNASANDGMQDISPPFQVAPTNVGTFQNAVWAAGGAVYTANVEPAEGTPLGINLRTVVRQGKRGADDNWTWIVKTIENRTLDSPWHTVPSIAVDHENFVHVAYNMHNMPWQYSVSRQPGSLDAFDFRGEALSLIQLGAVQYLNQTPFPALGSAAIPGTQITYPTFYMDRKGDLWVTYRFALKPNRDWSERTYGCGIARYDSAHRSWMAVGGTVPVGLKDASLASSSNGAADVTAFCSNPGWWANDIRLWFD
ncbi:MAG: BNR-4 repeat-containing protein, partial [Rhodomicrobium sp.]